MSDEISLRKHVGAYPRPLDELTPFLPGPLFAKSQTV